MDNQKRESQLNEVDRLESESCATVIDPALTDSTHAVPVSIDEDMNVNLPPSSSQLRHRFPLYPLTHTNPLMSDEQQCLQDPAMSSGLVEPQSIRATASSSSV